MRFVWDDEKAASNLLKHGISLLRGSNRVPKYDQDIVVILEVSVMVRMGATEFKAKCLGVLSEVESKRHTVILTKHGREVAKLVPMDLAEDVDPLDRYLFPGKIVITGDLMAPLYTDDELDEFERNSIEQLHDRS